MGGRPRRSCDFPHRPGPPTDPGGRGAPDPCEQERLLLFGAAELARRRLARGACLGATEAVALVRDEVLEMAWDGLPRQASSTGRAAAPEGGVVARDGSGEPTGLLQERAQQLVRR